MRLLEELKHVVHISVSTIELHSLDLSERWLLLSPLFLVGSGVPSPPYSQ